MFKTLSKEWQDYLGEEVLVKTQFKMSQFLDKEYADCVVYPRRENIFNALNLCPPNKVKVVILGQDPYHGENEAHGLAFSVQNGVKCPPSLRNIIKEISLDLGKKTREETDLSDLARQGVLLLNTVLTVRKDSAFSHKNKGWEDFTDSIIKTISDKNEHVVFMLWGKPAEKYEKLIDDNKHLILKSAHPSPLSAYRGFIGSKPFSQANLWLRNNGLKEIKW